MSSMIDNFRSKVSQIFCGAEVQREDISIQQVGQLEVTLNSNPLGIYGSGCKAGTVTIRHLHKKSFLKWDNHDLFNLARIERTYLFINERAGASNNLILGRQEGDRGEFTVTLVPYQKCNLIEKIKVFMRVLFKTWMRPITKEQAQVTAQFYRGRLREELNFETRPMPPQEKACAFCRSEVIEEQKVFDFAYLDRTHHILHDKWPKGEPHFLVVPSQYGGHYDGSNLDEQNRFRMLENAQLTARIALKEKSNSTLFVIERNGEQLQSVQHKHTHVISAKYPLDILWGRIRTVASICLAPFCAVASSHYQRYKKCDWLPARPTWEEGKGN